MDCKSLSPSRVNTFLECSLRYKYMYHDKIPEGTEESLWANLGSCYHKAIEEYLNKSKFEEVTEKTLTDLWTQFCPEYGIKPDYHKQGIEILRSWNARFDMSNSVVSTEEVVEHVLDNGVPVRLIIDFICDVNGDTLKIIDWKSGQVFSSDEMFSNVQAPMYLLVAKELYPEYDNYEFFFDFLRFNQIQYNYSEESLNDFKDWLLSVYNSIKDMKPEDARPKFNAKNCGYCGYKSLCPKMQDAKENNITFHANMNCDLNELIQQRMNLQDMIKSLDSYKSEMDKEIKVKLDMEQIDSLKEGSFTLKYKPREYKKYNIQTVYDAFSKRGMSTDVLSVRKMNVDKLMSILSDEEKEEIESSVHIDYSAPSLDIRRRKNG